MGLAVAILLVVLGGGYVLRRGLNVSPSPFAHVQVRQLTTNGKVQLAALSADSRLFAYVTDDFGQQSLWLGQTDGGNNILLNPPAESKYVALAFTPDGGALFFSLSDDANPEPALFRMPTFGVCARNP